MKDFKHLLIDKDKDIAEAIRQLDKGARKNLFLVDKNDKLFGTLTDGDIRRWIIKTGKLEGKVNEIGNRNPFTVSPGFDLSFLKQKMIEKNIDAVPVIDEQGQILEILFWEEIFGDTTRPIYRQIDAEVVIMAGGKGTRLDPFTRILPKPLIPVGEKTIAEIIMEEYSHYGIKRFYWSIHHMANMIKAYFEESQFPYEIRYLQEDKPLGTAGSLRFLKNEINKSFFVSNCDILIKEDYYKIFDFHKSGNFELTLVASMMNYTVPYGVCELKEEGSLEKIIEKPEFNFLVNTGMYIVEPACLDLIPENKFFHITHLIEKLRLKNRKVGVYPVPSTAYHDVGQWEQYRETIKKLGY